MAAFAAIVVAVLLPAAAAFAAAEDDAEARTTDEAVTAATRWLVRQQRAEGGFDGFVPGAATPDGLLALAESAQTEAEWDNRAAVERVESVESEDGKTPLDAARLLARRVEDPALAARLITMVLLPLGLDASEEGPLGDPSGLVVDGLADEDLPFDERIELAIALLSLGTELPEGTVDTVLGAQQPDGGWNADGDPEAEAVDLATTGAAVDLLVLAGVSPEDGPLVAAHRFVAATQTEDGAWPDVEGEPSALATAGAIRAIRAVGHDPAGTCWQTELELPAQSSTSPEAALVAFQEDDGRFAGEDQAVSTSQAVHALSGSWLPRGRAAEACTPESGGLPFEPSLLVLGAIVVVGVGGGVRILRSEPAY